MRFRLPLPSLRRAALALIVAGLSEAGHAQLVGLPPAPVLSPDGYQLILDYEVGGGRPYYEKCLARPTWPGAASGVTIGVGYDCGYNSAAVIRTDWDALDERARSRLAATALISGPRARPIASTLRDVLIRWNLAEGVFNRVSLARFYQLTARTFPGFEQLAANAQAALVSLTFNRGSSMSGPRRTEMRAIRAAVPRRDYREIAAQLRAMKHIWAEQGMEGLIRRREAEAQLVESCAR